MDIKEEIKEFLRTFRVKLIGFGRVPDIEQLEIDVKLPSVISFGFRVSSSVLATIKDHPTLLYKHHYKTINWLLDQTSYRLAQFIEDKGSIAIAIPASQLVNWESHKGHISHKALAKAAGLGHIGRSGLLINREYGAQIRYSSVLTDIEFEPADTDNSECGACQKCINACPGHAISIEGVDWEKCYQKLNEFGSIRGIGQHICGICVRVCDGRD
ncbi:hypothetical protein A2Y85_02030 [candidate division WOR-3 bacterium RBG_13_43_14]|uniref:4Fe-4S ferredoxin-type domain-containing protein n=1 Tax=candidate division WOR-3 bacterium RBG_13_43_14 TaxID=1802590 RepID=A0A1F4U2D9_UNCW3|nr:MAG: hypothetical protein A2Y85_02030 [candidate division WOR-3 bacterium RBG_13_43_14]